MGSKFKIYYLISSVLSIGLIIFSIFNIKDTLDNYNQVKQNSDSNEHENCIPFFMWRFSLFFNLFFLFACFGFLGYLIFKRNTSYQKVIFIKIGPTIDTIILIFLILSSILFGPLLIVEIIFMVVYYMEIIYGCKMNLDESNKNYFFIYVMLGIIMSILMSFVLSLICSRRCSRRRLMRRRNILNIGEIINII